MKTIIAIALLISIPFCMQPIIGQANQGYYGGLTPEVWDEIRALKKEIAFLKKEITNVKKEMVWGIMPGVYTKYGSIPVSTQLEIINNPFYPSCICR